MPAHFLLTPAAKTNNLVRVARMSKEEAETTFANIRWSATAALSFIKARIAKGTTVNADQSPNWNDLHANLAMKRINHEEAYSLDGACANAAEGYFGRLRRAEA